jgi:DNA-binding LytR/AlgR family response regulator
MQIKKNLYSSSISRMSCKKIGVGLAITLFRGIKYQYAQMNGIEFLKSSTSLPMVIMTTAYGQYALDSFELAVVDYLIKPFSLDRFIKAAQKALEVKKLKLKSISTDQDTNNHFFVKCDGRIERILYKDLLYIEAMTNYITLYTADGKLVVYLTIKGILEILPVNKFVQVTKAM